MIWNQYIYDTAGVGNTDVNFEGTYKDKGI